MNSANPDGASAPRSARNDLLLVVTLIALVLGGVGTFQGFQNQKQLSLDDSEIRNLTQVIADDNDTFGALGERIASLEKQLRGGVGGELEDPTKELALVRRDLQELEKGLNTGRKDELELRGALNKVITRVEELATRIDALEKAPRTVRVQGNGEGESIEKR